MKLLKLADFQNLSGLSDRALMWLLKNQKLACQCSAAGEILVDADSAEMQEIVTALKQQSREIGVRRASLIKEKLGQLVSQRVERVIDEAIAIYRSR
ncbi:MAG: hypothetical protein K1X83_15125 [Oligoflexia bacterium]|nr:hypothetical protein [Oligoflexia bacterium]